MNLELDGQMYEVDETLGKIVMVKLGELETLKAQEGGKETAKLTKELNGAKVFFGSKEALDLYEKAVASIKTFEEEKKEGKINSRLENLDKFASEGRIIPAEVENMKEFAKGLSDEQWSSFSKTLGNTPPIVKPGENKGKGSDKGPGSPKETIRVVEEALKFQKETGGDPKNIGRLEKKLENLKKEEV